MADYDADPIWSSSRTARQIHDLGRVEKVGSLALAPLKSHNNAPHPQDIGHLLSLASTSLALLSLPQTDAPDENLPEGDERSEQFVAKVGEYFETLDVRLLAFPSLSTSLHLHNTPPTSLTKSTILQGIQMALRSSLAHIRAARISPAVLTAPPAGFVPPPQGVGLPFPLPPGVSDRGSSGTGVEASHSQAKEKTRGLLEEHVERDAWRGALDALTRLMDARRAAGAEREG